MSTNTTNLPNLLAACAQAAYFAGNEVRQVVESNEDLQIVDKKSNDNTSATININTNNTILDPQTIADRKAQQVILTLLRKNFPNVSYVAEEEEESIENEELFADNEINMNHIPKSYFEGLDLDEQEENSNKISIWIDPMDGTQMFLSKRYEECSVLIGVAVNKRPVLGIIHLPFTHESYVGYYTPTFSLFLHGNYKSDTVTWKTHTLQNSTSNEIRIITSPKPSPKRDQLLQSFHPQEIKLHYSNAVGTMILRVLKHEADVYLRCREGAMRWDFCACDALLLAAGGRLVDCYGDVYSYDVESDSYKNMHGAIATLNISLLEKFLNRMSALNQSI